MKTPAHFKIGRAFVSFSFTVHGMVNANVLDMLFNNKPEEVYIYAINENCIEVYEDSAFKNFICSYTYDKHHDVYKTNMTERPDYICWICEIPSVNVSNESTSITTPDMLHAMDVLAGIN
jgi:hypothetical protein